MRPGWVAAGRLRVEAAVRGVPLLIFDGDCAFCTSSAHWLARRLNRPDGANARLVLAVHGSGCPWYDGGALNARPCGSVLTEPSTGAAAFAEWLKFGGRCLRGGWPGYQPAWRTRTSRRRLPRDREEPTPDARRISRLRAPSAGL